MHKTTHRRKYGSVQDVYKKETNTFFQPITEDVKVLCSRGIIDHLRY